jgi:hypothetical protein
MIPMTAPKKHASPEKRRDQIRASHETSKAEIKRGRIKFTKSLTELKKSLAA